MEYYLVKLYLFFFDFWMSVRSWFFWLFGPIFILKSYHNGELKNVTHWYYLSKMINIDGLKGIHYAKILHDDSHYEIIFDGHMREVDHGLFQKIHGAPKSPIKRKNVMLLNGQKEVMEVDLGRIDRYHAVTKMADLNHVSDLKTVVAVMGLDCGFVQEMQMSPFKRLVTEVDGLGVGELYH